MKLTLKIIIILVLLLTVLATYLLAGQPAARLTDYHVCPMVTALVPHVGGPISTASTNVFICGLGAARLGDNAVCVGPPDVLAMGSTTVLINGKPAVRLGDGTAHGGAVTVGCPTVIIGG